MIADPVARVLPDRAPEHPAEISDQALGCVVEHDLGRLAGLPVLEITTSWAGPICGCLLGDLGADVVKVEPTSACRPTRAR